MDVTAIQVWQVFIEQFGAAFALPFATPVSYTALVAFGYVVTLPLAAQTAGLFLACVMNLGLGVFVRRVTQGRIHLPSWSLFHWVARYQHIVWPTLACLCFIPVFPQLLFFAGVGSVRPWRLVPFIIIGCAVSALSAM